MNAVLKYLDEARQQSLETLKTYLRFPSVSADPARKSHVAECAEFTAGLMRRAGLDVEIVPTDGHPIVLGFGPKVAGPTLMIYGHYDVQPPDPLDLWRHGPFEPTLEGDNIVARGSSDDKGQILAHLLALQAFHETGSELPVNVIVIIEGEEEVGSHHLEQWLRKEKDRFSVDGVVLSDNQQLARGVPAICYALRGIAYMEIVLEGPNRDLHSGTYGGITPNPANALAYILGRMKDGEGRILIPGFYDKVRDLDSEERRGFSQLPFDEEEIRKDLGLDLLPGEPNYTTLERKWARPTLDVNGLAAGYMGEGAKTVIPAKAVGKVSMRLAPDQNAEEIADLFEQFVKSHCPPGIKARVNRYHNAPPVVIERDHPAMQAGMAALERGFGAKPVFIRDGASIPIVSLFSDAFKAPVVMLGFGLPDDNLHSPNEKFSLTDFHRGQVTSACFIEEFGRRVR